MDGTEEKDRSFYRKFYYILDDKRDQLRVW